MGIKDPATDFQTAREEWVNYRKSTLREMRAYWRKMYLPTMVKMLRRYGRQCPGPFFDGDVSEMEDCDLVEEQEGLRQEGLVNVSRWKHSGVFHNGGVVWDTPMAELAFEGKD